MNTKLDAIRQRARGPMFHPVPPAAASYRNVLRSQDVALMEWAIAIRTDVPMLLAVVEAAMRVAEYAPPLTSTSVGPKPEDNEHWYGNMRGSDFIALRAALAPLLEPEEVTR